MNQQEISNDTRHFTLVYGLIGLFVFLVGSLIDIQPQTLRLFASMGVCASVFAFTVYNWSRAYLNVEALTWGN